MLIEQSAYTNRWRRVSPAAKGIFSLCGMVAAFAAATPATACGVALFFSPSRLRGRDTAGALSAGGCSGAAFSGRQRAFAGGFAPDRRHDGRYFAAICANGTAPGRPGMRPFPGRSGGAPFLALTTPLIDIIALLRRLRAPEALAGHHGPLLPHTLCFSDAVQIPSPPNPPGWDMRHSASPCAPSAGLMANITVQVWQRSQALHLAAMARNNDGPLRFLDQTYANSARDIFLAVSGGAVLIVLASVIS